MIIPLPLPFCSPFVSLLLAPQPRIVCPDAERKMGAVVQLPVDQPKVLLHLLLLQSQIWYRRHCSAKVNDL